MQNLRLQNAENNSMVSYYVTHKHNFYLKSAIFAPTSAIFAINVFFTTKYVIV